MRNKIIFFFMFLVMIFIVPNTNAQADYGEDDTYLGQIVDSYFNDDYVNVTSNVIFNSTLNCMELNKTGVSVSQENFTLYTQVEEANEIILVNDSYIDMTLSRGWTSYAYYDFGVDGLNDYKIYGLFRQDYHDLNGWGAFCMMSNYLGGEKNHRDNSEDHIFFGVGGSTAGFRMWEYDSGSWYSTVSKVLPDDIYYWFKLQKTNTILEIDIYTSKALRDAEGSGDWYDEQLTLQNDYSFRYFYLGNSYDDSRSELMNMELYNTSFTGIGYASSGYYTTIDYLEGDRALVLLYNVTLAEGTGITMEYSLNGVDWLNHNNVNGYEDLISGFESIDLRDLNTTYKINRVNMTSTGWDTPRMYQLRYVTIIGEIENGGVDPTPSIIVALFLILVGVGLIYGVRRKR